MSEDSFNLDGDDAEMLEAIRAAFGEEAAQELDDVPELGGSSQPGSSSLEEVVGAIDNEALEGAKTALANAPQKPVVNEETLKFIVVEVSGTAFGIPMENVYEIQRLPKVTYLPGVPDWVRGVTNLRGNIVSVVSLESLLGLEATEGSAPNKRLVVTQSLVDDIDSGLIVDRVLGIRSYSKKQIQKPTAAINEKIERYLTGVVDAEHLVALLDVDKLLLSDEFRQFDAA